MNPRAARFYRAFGPGSPLPESHRREVVFCGRSNVGKSSLLNAFTGVRGLARTSKTPGRTREIHFYEIGQDHFLVDLPGYGYAKVSLTERRSWGGLVENYLARTDRIALAVLLVDVRHEPFETDLTLADALASHGIPFVVAFTKGDRASSSERARALLRGQEFFPAAEQLILTSAKEGTGVRDLTRHVESVTESKIAGR